MTARELGPEGEKTLDQVLGYLNFSSGACDVQFLANLNRLYGQLGAGESPTAPDAPAVSGESSPPAFYEVVYRLLRDRAACLTQTSGAFQNLDQARAVLGLVFESVLPAYLEFHRDLLFHQTGRSLFNSFFVGRVCEAVLQQGPPWEETQRITSAAIAQLNDYIGHRPVAALETQKIEPYAHEWVRPIPLYIRGAGAAFGAQRQVVLKALQILEETDEDLLRSAHFDLGLLNELAADPRAYDFDHPANKRPNYHFGQWDPHHIDNQGRYRRFVVQQVTLDALMQRLLPEAGVAAPAEELEFEAAAVLAGTILMASGVSGWGPGAHNSTVTLANLLPGVAAYRDAFYERLFDRLSGPHAERLRKEAVERRQPFGGARQHLNAQLARRRASQLEHVHLAKLFARMGYPQAASRQAAQAPVASARIVCQIDCWLTEGLQAAQAGDLDHAASLPQRICDLLHRAIECGAIIDPWNILGFDAHFSLFPALENSIRDYRADELISLMEYLFALYSRIWTAAAARDRLELCERISREFRDTATWWRQFAIHEVSSVECPPAMDLYHAAEHVARAMNLWHKGGAATGDVAFWAPHARLFDSPKAYSLVVHALLEQQDLVASMALLFHWLSQANRIGLEQGDDSFHHLACRWLLQLQSSTGAAAGGWPLVLKFFDYLEANADEYWQAPRFQLQNVQEKNGPGAAPASDAPPPHGDPEDSDDDDLFGAAYEHVTYRDSTADGIEGELAEGGPSDDALEFEARRLGERLSFLGVVARLWKMAALGACRGVRDDHAGHDAAGQWLDKADTFQRWASQAEVNLRGLTSLMESVHRHRVSVPSADHDALVEYDRRRLIKESLLERVITTSVETADAARILLAAHAAARQAACEQTPQPDAASSGCLEQAPLPAGASDSDQQQVIMALAAVMRGDAATVRSSWPSLLAALADKPLLYVPLAKGGDPERIVLARVRQQAIQDLMSWLPRLGLLTETCRLIEAAREMERANPVGPGAVTEFDELFKIGYKAMVESVVASAAAWPDSPDAHPSSQTLLVGFLERLTETLLVSWLAHSRTLRLSVLERVKDKHHWKQLVEFIERYGADLFTQRFFNLGNVRAILHQGVDAWLTQMQQDAPPELAHIKLLADLGNVISREEAVDHLSLVLEAIIENYSEYRDYNSTTTQSDRGELHYMLLDFLRLRMKYDRVAWNLKPVVLAHEILVRRNCHEAAELWRRALTERINDEADRYLRKLAELQKTYAMRMPTVADRIAERFVRPMVIDRMRALVEPAIRDAAGPGPHREFELLEQECEALTREPTGVGLDTPPWLAALEEEVELARRPWHERSDQRGLEDVLPRIILTREQLQQEIDSWTRAE